MKSDGTEKDATVNPRHDELYNLATAPSATKDLAADQPERVTARNAETAPGSVTAGKGACHLLTRLLSRCGAAEL